jgi:hypothetical protein
MEGETIPLFLEELEELKAVLQRIEKWSQKVSEILNLPLSITTQALAHELDDSSSSDIIINTKVIQTVPTLDSVPQAVPSSQFTGGDQIGTTMLSLFLESEGFPVELPHEGGFLIQGIQIRKVID